MRNRVRILVVSPLKVPAASARSPSQCRFHPTRILSNRSPREAIRHQGRRQSVVLNVTVLDEKGANVTSLKREDFVVYEDDTEQEISNFFPWKCPFTLSWLLDNSSSTRTSLNLIKNAALNFVNELRPDDHIAITEVNFFVRELQDFTNNRKTLAKALQKVASYPFGGSKIYDGIALGLKQLRPVETGRKAIVILSDGMENSK